MFMKAMQNVQNGYNLVINQASCESEQSLEVGHTIYNYMNSVSVELRLFTSLFLVS